MIMTADNQPLVEILELSEPSKQQQKIKKPRYIKSKEDSVLLCNRIILEMLQGEQFYSPSSSNYMQQVQTSITAGMRKTVTDWMLEICEDQDCASQVFLLSVQYLDRVLSCHRIFKSQLQLVAASCLFLASKLCEVDPLSVNKLVIYTDCSITSEQLLNMEMQILDKLSWELCAITSLDFLHIIVHRYTTSKEVLRNAAAFLSLAATEYQFYCVRPSMMAGAAFIAALQRENKGSLEMGNLHSTLSSLLSADESSLLMLSTALNSRISSWFEQTVNSSQNNLHDQNSNVTQNINIIHAGKGSVHHQSCAVPAIHPVTSHQSQPL